jgi:hypothetical protein
VVRDALVAGKCVVTANKALLAQRGEELFRLAKSVGVAIAFEASVCGGLPIIRPEPANAKCYDSHPTVLFTQLLRADCRQLLHDGERQ